MNNHNKILNLLSGNQLKLFALFAMTCDHIGKQLLPQYPILQIIGRLAFPIFACMIAEGCLYTKNRKRYILTMAVTALLCQMVYGVAMGSLYQCVLVTFSLSVAWIYVVDYAMKNKTLVTGIWAGIVFAGIYFVSAVLPNMLSYTDYAIDYGLWGVLLPFFAYVSNTKKKKLVMATIGLVLLCISMGGIQWYSLCAIPILALYSGKRGRLRLKNLFYLYYPLHLAGIYVISLFF